MNQLQMDFGFNEAEAERNPEIEEPEIEEAVVRKKKVNGQEQGLVSTKNQLIYEINISIMEMFFYSLWISKTKKAAFMLPSLLYDFTH